MIYDPALAAEYRRFLLLKFKFGDYDGSRLHPSQPIEQFWKEHRSNATSYKTDCESSFGRIIEAGAEISFESSYGRYQYTLLAYKEVFQMDPPKLQWPAPKRDAHNPATRDVPCLCKTWPFYSINTLKPVLRFPSRSSINITGDSCLPHCNQKKKPSATDFNTPYQIFIRGLTGDWHTITVTAGTTVAELKVLVRDKTMIPTESQRLIWSGKRLSNEMTMDEYGVTKESTVYLYIPLTGC
ncbi:hypothetical protein PROFUN_04127 [Planoprotostelium fungivorum]|uniref:Ubiquitin-like domain-containing protein n=1 Tax=Planoprotostelium fungivorum TaxID=1890364 RepID=A0A2P6NJK0_9EUKA|nr:hypothetical protein PROFUN_04127 [Planoprotostelium fungivorum]